MLMSSWAMAAFVALLYWVAGRLAVAPAEPRRVPLELRARTAEDSDAPQCPAASPQTASRR